MKSKKDPKNPLLDFRNFVFMVWQHLNLPDPTPVQYDMAEYLQHAPKRAVIEAEKKKEVRFSSLITFFFFN